MCVCVRACVRACVRVRARARARARVFMHSELLHCCPLEISTQVSCDTAPPCDTMSKNSNSAKQVPILCLTKKLTDLIGNGITTGTINNAWLLFTTLASDCPLPSLLSIIFAQICH